MITSVIYIRSVFLLALTVAFGCALVPGSKLMGVIPLGGYLVHLITFIVLGFLIDLSYISHPVVTKIVFLSVLGALIEVAQYFVPCRSSSFVELTVDIVGILMYFLLVRWFLRRFLIPLLPGLSACPAVEAGSLPSPAKLS